jgi:riboflavin kinase / FMN adenylyltransferase
VVEAYALDFTGDLYGRQVAVEFVDRVRDEQRFETVDALLKEMARDVATVQRILTEMGEPGELILDAV